MDLAEALEAAKRLAASRGERLGELLGQERTTTGGWVFEFDVTDDPPNFSWWIMVTPTGEGQIMEVAPRF